MFYVFETLAAVFALRSGRTLSFKRGRVHILSGACIFSLSVLSVVTSVTRWFEQKIAQFSEKIAQNGAQPSYD